MDICCQGFNKLSTNYDQEQEPLPLLPQISMVWFFIIAAVVAIGLLIVSAVDDRRALPAALAYTAMFVAAFFGIGSLLFFIAYMFGATEHAVANPHATSNPFADGNLPPQLIPPRASDEQA